ncbi:MAG: tetratricopeptide repeat protein, partial [Thermomicrobiales bacterium]
MGTGSSSSRSCVSNAEETPTLDDVVRELLALPDETARQRFVAHCLKTFAADDLLPHFKFASERYLTIDEAAALQLAQILAFAGEYLARPEYRALGLLAVGDALRSLGHFVESVAVLDEAGQLFLGHGDDVGWARTRTGWIVSSHHLGRGKVALVVADRAHDILTSHQEWLRAATLDSNAGWICYELGEYQRALTHYDRALAAYALLGEAAEIRAAWAKANKAIALTHLADFHTALQLLEEARQVAVRHGDTASVLRQDHNIAYVYAGQGRYTQALQRYSALRTAREQAGPDIEAAWVALNMVECYLKLNRYAEAQELAAETAARFERCGTPTEAAKARYLCALAYSKLGELDRALTLLDEAGQVFASAGLSGQLALVTLQRALLHLDDGDWRAAGEAAAAASVLFAERGLVIRRAQADLERAWAALGRTE